METKWQYDTDAGERFYYDWATYEYVYESGRRFK